MLLSGVPTLNVFGSFSQIKTGDSFSGLVSDAGGNLYGTTSGLDDKGTIFEIPRGTTTIQVLATFNGTNGANPSADLFVDAIGDLFGTTVSGGANNKGTVFELGHSSHTIITYDSFNGTTTGMNPISDIVADSSGNIFGTTAYGGTDGDGTVYEIRHDTRTIVTLASFDGANGRKPKAGLVLDANHNLYGTTFYGGAQDHGAVFKIANGTNTITLMDSFIGTNGANPSGDLAIDSAGNLFGTSSGGADGGAGTVFEIPSGTSKITTLAKFNSTDGAYSHARVTLDSKGDLFGTATAGGAFNDGTLFEVVKGSGAITALASFDGTNSGSAPHSSIAVDAGGNLYGTTTYGGLNNTGVVFEYAASQQLAFTNPPVSTQGGSQLGGNQGIEVAVTDSVGHTLTSNSSTITLTLNGGTFASGGNTATAPAVNGIATFFNLAINTSGNYTITARDGTLPAVTSPPFGITSNLGSISGTVFNDINGNGAQNSGEAGLRSHRRLPRPKSEWQARFRRSQRFHRCQRQLPNHGPAGRRLSNPPNPAGQ